MGNFFLFSGLIFFWLLALFGSCVHAKQLQFGYIARSWIFTNRMIKHRQIYVQVILCHLADNLCTCGDKNYVVLFRHIFSDTVKRTRKIFCLEPAKSFIICFIDLYHKYGNRTLSWWFPETHQLDRVTQLSCVWYSIISRFLGSGFSPLARASETE